MRRPDDEFINQFRERFGDLILIFHDERRMVGAHVDSGDRVLPASHANENGNGPIDVMWTDEANAGLTLRLEGGFPRPRNSPASNPFTPLVCAKKPETFHDRNLPGSGAVFHNKAGDLNSPMIRWNANFSPLINESIQDVPRISWNGPDCFTPLADSQHWLCDNTPFGQADDISRTLMHRDSGHDKADGADQDNLTDGFNEPDPNFDLATTEARVNAHWPYGGGEKFRYQVTLHSPTAVLWHANESPITYLNKGQTYSLTVVDSTPPTKTARFLEYRTFVHVSFEEEDQRSNPGSSWQL